jgi:hypothetical protein
MTQTPRAVSGDFNVTSRSYDTHSAQLYIFRVAEHNSSQRQLVLSAGWVYINIATMGNNDGNHRVLPDSNNC